MDILIVHPIGIISGKDEKSRGSEVKDMGERRGEGAGSSRYSVSLDILGGPTTCAIQRLKEKRKEMDEHRVLILPGFLRLSEGVQKVLCLIHSKMQCPPSLPFSVSTKSECSL